MALSSLEAMLAQSEKHRAVLVLDSSIWRMLRAPAGPVLSCAKIPRICSLRHRMEGGWVTSIRYHNPCTPAWPCPA